MDQVLNGKARKKDIDPLPDGSDDFWQVGLEEAQNEVHKLIDKSCMKGHYFVYVSSWEAQCNRCPIGYILTPGYWVKDGHIYNSDDELVI